MDTMLKELIVNPSFAWLILAAVMAIVEVITPTFGFILVGVSAVVTAIVAGFGMATTTQVSVFILATGLSLWFVRPKLVARLYGSQGVQHRNQAMIGKEGIVTKAIRPSMEYGRIDVMGEDWAATSDQHLPEGTKIGVIGADGIILKVNKQ